MPRPLGHIHILLSSRVIFDLEEGDAIFAKEGAAKYADYMRGQGDYAKDYDANMLGRKLRKGPLWEFANALMKLNEMVPPVDGKPMVELGLVCKDTTDTLIPIFRNLDALSPETHLRISTAGQPLTAAYFEGVDADLFLSRNVADVQMAVDSGIAAAVINYPPGAKYQHPEGKKIRLGVDLDGVVFGGSAEVFYRENGVPKYRQSEFDRAATPIEAGPYTKLLAKISQLNARFPKGEEPFEILPVTARGGTAATRALVTAESLGIRFNAPMHFMGGASKEEVLKAHKVDLFFDDQQVHLAGPSAFCATGHVAYPTDSPMYKYLAGEAAKAAANANPAPAAAKPAKPGKG